MKLFNVILFCIGAALPSAAQVRINGSQVIEGAVNSCDDVGVSGAYACDLARSISGYVAGSQYCFKAGTTNPGATTLNLNNLGSKVVRKYVGSALLDLAPGDIAAGQRTCVIYDGSYMQLITRTATASGLSAPGVATMGGVKAVTCPGTDKLSAIGTDGGPVCSPDQTGGSAGSQVGSITGAVPFPTVYSTLTAEGDLAWPGIVAGTVVQADWHNLPAGLKGLQVWTTADTLHFTIENISEADATTPTIMLGATIANYYLTCSGTPSWPAAPDTLDVTVTLSCPGATVGDKPVVAWTPSASGLIAGTAWVGSSDSVTIPIRNNSGADATPSGAVAIAIAK